MSTSKCLERYDIALKTRRWWAIPWWQEDQYKEAVQFSTEEVKDAFEMLKKLFDEKWFISQRDSMITEAKRWLKGNEDKLRSNTWVSSLKGEMERTSDPLEHYKICKLIGFHPAHPLFNELLIEGLCPFNYLVKLGRDLCEAEGANLLGDLRKRLKSADQYLGAHFELEMLSYLLRRGFSIIRDFPSGTGNKKCDLRIEKASEVVYIELKRLQPSRTNKDINDISNLIFHIILSDPLISSTPNILNIELSSDLRANAATKKGLNSLRESWQIIAQQIKGHIVERIKSREWGHHTALGLAEYDLYAREGERVGGTGGFVGLPLLHGAEAEKMFQNAVDDAIAQLPKNQAGVVMVSSPFPLDLKIVQQLALSMVWKDRQKYNHVSAMVLIYTYFSQGKIRYHLGLARNPDATYNVENYAAIRDILSLGDH